MEEVWKHVENFEGYYEVSNLGRVRRNWHGKYKLLKTGYVGGYQRVILSKEGTQTSLAVHRLVMESFKGIDFDQHHLVRAWGGCFALFCNILMESTSIH